MQVGGGCLSPHSEQSGSVMTAAALSPAGQTPTPVGFKGERPMGLCKSAQGELVIKVNWESAKEASQPQICFYLYGAKNQPCMLFPRVSLSPSTAQGFGAGGSMSSIVLHLTPQRAASISESSVLMATCSYFKGSVFFVVFF